MLSYPGLGAALGVLPPPNSLCSVPLMTTPPAGIMDATAVSRPTPHTAVSWFNPPIPAVPTVQGAPATASAEVSSTSASLLPAVSLSPATEPFPRKLVEKIQAGQFVEMKELLSDNIALLQQLDVFQGQCAAWCTEVTSPRGSDTTFVALQLLGLHGRPYHTRQVSLRQTAPTRGPASWRCGVARLRQGLPPTGRSRCHPAMELHPPSHSGSYPDVTDSTTGAILHIVLRTGPHCHSCTVSSE